MAAILKLRRGTSIPSLVESELFFNTTNQTVVVGDGSTNHTLVKIGVNTGSVEFTGDITASNLTITGNALVQGNITFGGSLITIGDENTDDIVFVGELSSSLIPNNDNAFDIGSSTRRYKTIYGVSASFENVSLPGTGILSSSLQDFDTYSSSIESQLDSVYTFTQSADQRLTSIEGFTQSVDLRVDDLEASQSYFDTTFSSSVDLRLDNAESTGSDHESRIDAIETTFSSSVDLRLDNLELTGSDHESRVIDLESTGSDHETRITSIEGYSSSLDSRLDDLEETGSNHELRIDDLELSQSYFDNTFSGSVDTRLDLLENFSSSEYQADSSSFDSRLDSIEGVTGSYATTGSNTFIGNQTITGSIIGSGSVSFNSIPWPSIGNETHLFKTEPYTVNLSSGNRDYEYLGVALEQVQTGSIYENSFLFYTYDSLPNATYGSETLLGPIRTHMRVLPSGSGHHGNISIEDIENGSSRALFYADDIQIGFYTGSSIQIGNTDSINTIRGSITYVIGDINATNAITASAFIGNGSKLTNVTASYVEFDDIVNKPSLVSGSSQINVNQTQNFQSFSSSVDSRLDQIEGPLSSSIDNQLNTIQSYTASLKNAIEVSGQNLTVFGDLVVEGTTTTINTQELLIEDKLLAIASGSTTSTDADGGGFFISGADASILWNHLNQTLDFNTKVSSSVGFKGDGTELTGVLAANVEFDDILNKPTLVSGSSQIDLTNTTNYISGIKDRLNAEGIFSQSAQVNADDITNFDTNVKDKLDSDNVHSGSYLGTATTSNLTEGINLYWTNDRFLTASYQQGLISGSVQITDGSNLVSSSQQISNYGIFAELNGDNLVSGSSQIDLTQTTNYVSGIKDRLNFEGVISGSDQVTQSLDLRYINTDGDGVISGSSQVDLTQTTNYISGIKDRLNTEGVISGSSQVTESLDSRYLEIQGDGVISGSSQVDFTQISNKPSLVSGSAQITLSDTVGYNTFSSSLDSRLDLLEGDQHTHSNKTNLDSIDQDLSTLDTPTFANISLPSITSLPTASEFSVLLYSQSGEITYSELGTAAYYHVSQSISSGDPNVLGNAKAVKDYIDEQLIIIGAGDITSVNAGDGMSGGALSGSATLTLDTGSSHFTSGVISSLPSGLISASSQVNADSITNFDSNVLSYINSQEVISGSSQVILESADKTGFTGASSITTLGTVISGNVTSILPGGVVSGSNQIDITQTTNYPQFSSSIETRLFNLELFSTSLDDSFVTETELGIATNSLENLIDTKLDTGSYNTDSQSFDNRIDNLEAFSTSLDDDFVTQGELATATGSLINSIATKLNTGSYNTDSSSFHSRIDTLESESHENPLTFTDSSTIDFVRTDDSITAHAIGGIVSGSGQLTDMTGDITVNSSGVSAIGNGVIVNTDINSSAAIAHTKLNLNGSGIISGSSQLTSSYDSRYLKLSGGQSVGGNTTFQDITVNGTGSFAYIQSVTGSAKIIGDAFIVVNNDTPSERYAGLSVYDSGSVSPTTASLFFDGQLNDWNYEYNVGGTIDYGVVMFGPEYNTKGSPTYLTNNRIPKGDGGHHLNDSNISDTGTLITLGSNTVVSGTLIATGTTLVSGSNQVTKSLQDVCSIGNTTNTTISITNSTASTSKTTGALVVTGGIGTSGTINAGGDVIAYASSDERLKDEITPIENSLQKINSIGGYSFVWNEKQDIYKGKDYGVIAQEIENILPELVETRENGYKAVKYDRIVSLLIEGIKELSKEVSELKEKIGK